MKHHLTSSGCPALFLHLFLFEKLQSHTHKDCTAGQQLSLMAANQATKLLTGTNGAQRRHRAQGAFNSGKRGAKGLDVSQHRAAPCTETCCPCLPTLQLTRGIEAARRRGAAALPSIAAPLMRTPAEHGRTPPLPRRG